MKQIQHEHGQDSVAFLSTGQIATEEMALLGALAKFGMGMLHGDGNTRQCMATAVVAYKQSFGFDAPPYTYADFEAVGRDCARRQQPLHCASDHVAARDAQPARSPNHRHRSAHDRNGDGGHAALAAVAEVRSGAVLRRGPAARSSATGSTTSSSPRTPTGSRTFERFVEAFPIERVVAETGIPAAADRETRDDDSRRSASVVLVDDGRQPKPSGSAHRAGDHQPRADDRQHRSPRHRRELDHRPVQRDGLAAVQQHDQPARRPRL